MLHPIRILILSFSWSRGFETNWDFYIIGRCDTMSENKYGWSLTMINSSHNWVINACDIYQEVLYGATHQISEIKIILNGKIIEVNFE